MFNSGDTIKYIDTTNIGEMEKYKKFFIIPGLYNGGENIYGYFDKNLEYSGFDFDIDVDEECYGATSMILVEKKFKCIYSHLKF